LKTLFDKEKYKNTALKILSPITPATDKTSAIENFLFNAQRSDASVLLPEYYFIYFLFADLLGFKNLGKFEKIAWSFPIDYNGRAFLVEYRKFGVGIFVQDKDEDEKKAAEIVRKINGAIKSVRPFYDNIAEEAVKNSKFNIVNNNDELYKRFEFLLSLYKKEYRKFQKNKGKVVIKSEKKKKYEYTLFKPLDLQFYQKANWLAISCIESFFSWTEHLFIHLSVVAQNLSDGRKISDLIDAEWKIKFKSALPDNDEETIRFYDELLLIRQQLRNFIAHGAFGKNGNAFLFHSKTGLVPVLMRHKRQKDRFSLYGFLTFREEDVIKLIEDFIEFLWKGSLNPAMYYTQKCRLPTILPYAENGIYKAATIDSKSIREFSQYLSMQIDNSLNMDW